MFSGFLSLANGAEHDIKTNPTVQVRVKSYRIPETHRKAVPEELQRMLEHNVIEKSKVNGQANCVGTCRL